MAEYLIAGNYGDKVHTNIHSELIRRTDRGYFLIKPAKTKPVRLLHVKNWLGPKTLSLDSLSNVLLDIPGFDGRQRSGTYIIEPLRAGLGHSVGRVARPTMGWGAALATIDNETQRVIANRIRYSVHLHERLLELGNTIDLVRENLPVFGNSTRDILMVACLEVEALFKLLMFKDYQAERGNIERYWRVSKHAKLPDYIVSLAEAPELGEIRPFSEWSDEGEVSYRPLPWYQAYNLAKHNAVRGNEVANLEHALTAICAGVVLINALQGSHGLTLSKRVIESFRGSFQMIGKPSWSPGDYYYKVPGQDLQITPL
ncbi:hypothetical protein [Fodinicurvata fenggangensis]|uniref:hypothetical protein n=1 Tax=Fodinicurvata fenggangensis TaxID=1121830 RepID=UPI0012DC7E1C|nr:hypothetical protein [Fodinicurvata fenggangensis]